MQNRNGIRDEEQEDILHAAGCEEDWRFVHHLTPLAERRKDSSARNPIGGPNPLALDGRRHCEGPQGEGHAKTRPETEGRQAMSTRAAIYARVSTLGNGQSPEMQLRELREYCEHRSWQIAGEYVDVGISGTKDRRPQLDRMMSDAHKRRFDVVAVWKFDRFARSVSHLLRALDTFRVLGIGFVSL